MKHLQVVIRFRSTHLSAYSLFEHRIKILGQWLCLQSALDVMQQKYMRSFVMPFLGRGTRRIWMES